MLKNRKNGLAGLWSVDIKDRSRHEVLKFVGNQKNKPNFEF